jgi:endonuclease III
MRSASQRRTLLAALSDLYPVPESELLFQSPYQLLIAVVLSAQCTDKKVNQATPRLFELYPTFKALASAPINIVEETIRSLNYYKNKSKHIVALSQEVEERFGGEVPHSHDDLVTLPGVGRKTANVVISELGLGFALAVDTHVFRVSRRLGLSEGKNVRQVEEDLMKVFKPETWRILHHSLILHGRRVCTARIPRCGECVLRKNCTFGSGNTNT